MTISQEHASDQSFAKALCKLCASSEWENELSVRDVNFSDNISDYDIRKCRNCGLFAIHPFPSAEELESLYKQEHIFTADYGENLYKKKLFYSFFEDMYAKYGMDHRFIARSCRKILPTASSVLDIGCNKGELLQVFQQNFPDIKLAGIDIDPDARKGAHPSVASSIQIGDFLEQNYSKPFDIISLRFVIEHLSDPRSYIQKARSLLAPGGVLFLSAPDITSPKAQLLGQKWDLIDNPRQRMGHVHWFGREVMQAIADQEGFKLLQCSRRGEVLHHFPNFVQTILRSLLGQNEHGRFIRSYSLRMSWAVLMDGLVSEKLGLGDCVYAFFQRQDIG